MFERQANAQDIEFVNFYRRNEEKVELAPGASRQPDDTPCPLNQILQLTIK